MSVLVALQGGTPAVDFTASFTQAPASWAATAEETLPTTASFTQAAATWAAAAAETNPTTASFTQAAATWQASLAETLTSTGSWTQAAATWSATAAESLDTTASFVQAAATWEAQAAQSIETAFIGAWTQAAASWAASAAESLSVAGSFVQAAATWDATADSADNSFAAAWEQTQTWAAEMDTPIPEGFGGGLSNVLRFDTPRIERTPQPQPIPVIGSVARFVQPAASWAAEMDTYDPDILALVFDEPALIGAR